MGTSTAASSEVEIGQRQALRLFTVDEVLRMVEVGILDEDEPVELLDGELIVMSPQGPAHRTLAVLLRDRLQRAYGDRCHVQDHSNIVAGERSLPEPDVAVVRGDARAYFDRLPTGPDLVLVAEVAVTSQRIDLRKAAVYARAGVATYWVIDVVARRVHVFADPGEGGYGRREELDEHALLALPESDEVITLAELLPPPQ
jgi:Uma2 family endonuclease